MHKEHECLGTARRIRAKLDIQNVVDFKNISAMHECRAQTGHGDGVEDGPGEQRPASKVEREDVEDRMDPHRSRKVQFVCNRGHHSRNS